MLSSALTRCRDRDVDLNAVVLTATGREKNTAALVSPSLIAIHVNAKTVSLFLMHTFILTVYYQLSVAQFPAGDFRFPCHTLNRFHFFNVFRSRVSRYCEGVSRHSPPAPAAAVMSETDRRCYKAGSLHDALRCRLSTAV